MTGHNPGISPNAGVDEIRNWLSKSENRLAVDWRCIWPEPSQLLSWGDNCHEGLAVKQTYIDSVPELKAIGLTHVGFEVLPQFLQEKVDEFSQLKTGDPRLSAVREELIDALDQQWEVPLEANVKYVEMLDASRLAGVKILCLEPSIKNAMGFERGEGFPLVAEGLKLMPANYLEELQAYARGQTHGEGRLDSRKRILDFLKGSLPDGSKAERLMDVVDAMSTNGFDFNEIEIPGEDNFQNGFLLRIAEWRNRIWKKVIDRSLESGESARNLVPSSLNAARPRMLVFAGIGHLGHLDPYRTLNDELNDEPAAQYHPVTVCFSGAASAEEVQEGRELVQQNKGKPWTTILEWQITLFDAMREVPELRDGFFAFRIADDGPNKPADYMIHLKQK